jgi:putative heme transporter
MPAHSERPSARNLYPGDPRDFGSGLGGSLSKMMGDDEGSAARRLWSDRLGRWAVRSLQLLSVLALVTVTILGLIEIKLVVIPFLISLIIAAAMRPLIVWLRAHHFPPILAAWTALLGALGVLGGTITLIVATVRSQWDELARASAAGYEQLKSMVRDLPAPFSDIDWDGVRDRIVELVTSPRFGVGALAGVTTVLEILGGMVFGLVLLFFFLKDGDRMWGFFKDTLAEREHRERDERVAETSVGVFGGYLRGTAIIALVDAVAIGIGLVILRVPLAFPLSVLVFLGSFIPYAGAVIAGALAALVALVANGPLVALGVVAVALGVNQLEGDLLQPVIMSQTVSLHPLVVLMALAAGAILSGIVGALLAVPITAAAWATIKVWEGPAKPPAPRRRRRFWKRSEETSD